MASLAIDSEVMAAARQLIARVSVRFDVVEARLFGSHARGEAHAESDIDVAFVIRDEDDVSVYALAAALGADAADVLLDTGQVVEAIPIKLGHWLDPAKSTNPWFVKNVWQESVVL